MQRQEAFDVAAWRNAHAHPSLPAPAGRRCCRAMDVAVLLRARRPAPMAAAFARPPARPPTCWWPWSPGAAGAGAGNFKQNAQGTTDKRGQLYISYLPPPQAAFDEMLWACDLNAVRGEDSLVRGLWAGRRWSGTSIPQDDDAHHAKLQAFLDWLQAPASLRQFHHTWNGLDDLPCNGPMTTHCANGRRVCRQPGPTADAGQPVAQLLGFVMENGKIQGFAQFLRGTPVPRNSALPPRNMHRRAPPSSAARPH